MQSPRPRLSIPSGRPARQVFHPRRPNQEPTLYSMGVRWDDDCSSIRIERSWERRVRDGLCQTTHRCAEALVIAIEWVGDTG